MKQPTRARWRWTLRATRNSSPNNHDFLAMPIEPSSAGPFTLTLREQLASDGSEQSYRFENIEAGPADKEGWLTKFYGDRGGLDYIRVTNTSQYDLFVIPTGGGPVRVESATSLNFDSGPQVGFRIYSAGGGAIGPSDVTINVGNISRGEDNEGPNFSARSAVEDIIPGVSL